MGWDFDLRYRARANARKTQVQKNSNGTQCVVVVCDVTVGQAVQEVRYTGYLNDDTNRENTETDLRVMGWTGTRWGDWAGLGSKEFTGKIRVDESIGDDGKPRKYVRLVFPQALAELNREKQLSASELAALPPPRGPKNGAAPRAPAAAPDTWEEREEEQIPFGE